MASALGTNLSDGRQTWQPIWSQWNNAFQGFTGFSDVSGPGQLILDGDPLIMRSFANAAERQSAINLFVMAGAAIAIADQYNTIGENAAFYTNEEILEVRQAGLVGKPVYLNSHVYDWDQTSRDSQRWVGQLPDGSWVVGLFNRADTGAPITQTLDFASILGLTEPAMVRDLWAHQDMGSMTSWSATLGTTHLVTGQGHAGGARALSGTGRSDGGDGALRELRPGLHGVGLCDGARHGRKQRRDDHRSGDVRHARPDLPCGQWHGQSAGLSVTAQDAHTAPCTDPAICRSRPRSRGLIGRRSRCPSVSRREPTSWSSVRRPAVPGSMWTALTIA